MVPGGDVKSSRSSVPLKTLGRSLGLINSDERFQPYFSQRTTVSAGICNHQRIIAYIASLNTATYKEPFFQP
ncbi:Glucose N-acetyltransferase 1 [Fusarium oxysporum f. sp. albedinis]|nr:Glucose N-acetyltransferase 1 [Fusarium oxysporum f. sp. albedinis]